MSLYMRRRISKLKLRFIDKEDKKMRYIVMDEVKNGDIFTEEHETLEAAIESAEYDWNHLSESDKKHRESFIVLKSANPDVDAENHLDGDIVKRWK